jgi:hypothetical protein
MDAFLVLVIIIFVICWYRSFPKTVYAIASTDILLRICNFLAHNLKIEELASFFDKYFADSIPSVIAKYTNSDLYNILLWAYVILMIVFLFYTVRIFFKKR